MADSIYDYTFNQNDYECIIRIYNGQNDIYLRPEGWENLLIEEDIFDWKIKGSIIIKTPYDSLEKESDESISLFSDRNKLVYKFRNDGRDTLYISIRPKAGGTITQLVNDDFKDQLWCIELETVIYEVEDLENSGVVDKMKRLYFWEKSYQMMTEKNIEFSTAIVGDNLGKTAYKLSNDARSLKTGMAIGELFKNDTDFAKFVEQTYSAGKDWNMGDDKNKIFYTSATNARFINDLDYLLTCHTSTEDETFQPCIFKFERAETKGQPKQFTLKSINDYFKKAGTTTPGEYELEHFFISEKAEEINDTVAIQKVPFSDDPTTSLNMTAEDYSNISNYKVVDMYAHDYADHFLNRYISSFNDKKGQFNIEIKNHKTEKFQEFYTQYIMPNILTKTTADRLPLTPYITNAYNAEYIYSVLPTEESRISAGRNKLLQYYMFSNLGIAFSLRGLTIRQPGRFFGVSKNTKNDKDYDHKLEGQYFTTNIIHYFSNQNRSYTTQITGIKMHTYLEQYKLPTGDVNIL